MGTPQIDTFKTKAIKRLDAQGEALNHYHIDESDLTKLNHCTLCASENISRLTEVYLEARLNFLSTSVCNDCAHMFRSIFPSIKWFKRCWKQIATTKLEVFSAEIETIRKNRYENYYETLSKYIQSGRLLDVGAAYGTGTKVFRDHGFEVEAIEPEDDRANYLNNYFNIPVMAESIDEMRADCEKYDIIIFAHCLEHVDDPTTAVLQLKNLMNKDTGILYIEVPIFWYYGTWNDAFFLAHKNNFLESTVVSLLNRFGFEVIEKTWPWEEQEQIWHLGLVLKYTNNAIPVKQVSRNGVEELVNEIRRLFRKHLPLDRIPPLETVLKYEVPYIEHFYQTLRFDTKEIIEPKSSTEFISIRPK